MGNGMLTGYPQGADTEPETVRGVTCDIACYRTLVIFHISPYQGDIQPFCGVVKELF